MHHVLARKTDAMAPAAVRAEKAASRRLPIGVPNDSLEQEADRVADEVMASGIGGRNWSLSQMSIDPPLQRKCSCGGSGSSDGQCSGCKEKEEEALQRKAVGAVESGVAPPIVHEVLRSPGQPLDRATRDFFEPRFGYDFSRVRIFDDSAAAKSAREVSANAYTVADRIVFDAGKYAPGSHSGRRLLAHELAHVVRQRGKRNSAKSQSGILHPSQAGVDVSTGAGPMLARDASKTTVEVTGPTGPPNCTLENHRVIKPAVDQAVQWLNSTIQKLDAYNPNSTDKKPDSVRSALDRHFHSSDAGTATDVRGRLDAIRTDINTRTTLKVECHDKSDTTCGIAGAYSSGNLMVFCPNFFEGDELGWRSETVIHESAHALVGGKHIEDRGYRSDRTYAVLTTKEALTNAESFGLLVQELGTGKVVGSRAPTDSFSDCNKDDWKPLIKVSIARAQRWNRDAQNKTSDRRPLAIAGWTNLQQKYLGATTIVAIDSAKKVYDKLEGELHDDIGFECESDAKSGRCGAGAQTYWYLIWSHFHLCPSWKNLPTDETRIVAMLAGLYGFLGDVDDNARRWNLANLARELTAIVTPPVEEKH